MLPYYVTPDKIDWFVNQALIEDVGSGDHTTLACIPDTQSDKAILKVKDEGIIAGIELAKVIIQKLDPNCSFTTFIKDGDSVSYGDIAFELSANSHALLKAERL
ncbi:MAG TPA: nicotinate-nucleotide diphosphorylase (carboxylating), partial [Saprospiraceae bacterium]|nr:nicotinate-nucleotide diphosphorylase (carboxylating) [Saprospiraceae bacterium]